MRAAKWHLPVAPCLQNGISKEANRDDLRESPVGIDIQVNFPLV